MERRLVMCTCRLVSDCPISSCASEVNNQDIFLTHSKRWGKSSPSAKPPILLSPLPENGDPDKL